MVPEVLVPLDAHIVPISHATESRRKPLNSQEVPTISVCTVCDGLDMIFSRFSECFSMGEHFYTKQEPCQMLLMTPNEL